MKTDIDLLKSANRKILDGLAEQDRTLGLREEELTKELEDVVNLRKRLKDDFDVLVRAEKIQLRLLAASPEPLVPAPIAESGNKVSTGQTRARIGPQRYFMLTALRERGTLTVQEIADITGLNISRVREQMRADSPAHVDHATSDEGVNSRLSLTQGGLDLLHRFENYRRSEGKPLPTLGEDDDETSETATPSVSGSSLSSSSLSEVARDDADFEYEDEPAPKKDRSIFE